MFPIFQAKTFEWRLGGLTRNVKTASVSQDASGKGSESQGFPFKSDVNEMSSSVHLSDASFRAKSLISGTLDSLANTTHSDTACFPNAIEGASGIKMMDTTRSFEDESGPVMPPQDTGDSLGGPKTVTSSPKSDTVPKTNQSQRDSSPNIDQSQQDSSSSPNTVVDTS